MGFFLQLFGAAHAAHHAGHAVRGVVHLTRGVGHASRLAGHSTRLAGHAARHSTRYVSHARYVGHARHAGHTAVHARHSTQAARQSNMCTGHPTRHTTQVTRHSTSCHIPNHHQHQSRCHSGTTQGSSCPRTHHRLHGGNAGQKSNGDPGILGEIGKSLPKNF